MNARENTLTPLRNLIAIHLDAAGESPADKIAEAIGKADYPSVVIKELNAMRTDGLVECEQRGKKKELTYWLSVPLSQVTGIEPPAAKAPQESTPAIVGCLPVGITEGTRAAQIWSVLPDHGEPPISAREIAVRAKKVIGLIAPVLTTMHQRSQIARVSESSEGYLYTRPAPSVATEPQPAEGNITGSSASDVVTTPSEGVAVHQPAPDAAASLSAAPVAEDDTHQLDDINVADLDESLRDMLDDTRLRLNMLREALGVPEEPHQSLFDRMMEEAELASAHRQDVMAWESAIEGVLLDVGSPAMAVERINLIRGERDETVRQYGILRERHDSYEQAIGKIHRACTEAGIPVGHVAERVQKLAAESDERGKVLDQVRAMLGPLVCGNIDPSDLNEAEMAVIAATMIAEAGKPRDDDDAVDVLQAASGYILTASKRKPRRITKPEAARDAALAAIRNGAQRAKVFALVPIGEARRGAEWRDA